MLDGPWRFRLDSEDRGRTERWFEASGPPEGASAACPHPEARPVWCFQSFEAPPALAGSLCIDLLPDTVTAWLNGKELQTSGSNLSGTCYQVDGILVEGQNTLAIRVSDAQGPLPPVVRLEHLPAERLDSVFIQPDIRRRRLTVTVETTAPGRVQLRIDGTENETTVETTGPGPVKALVEFPEFDFWSPRTPTLYTLQAAFQQEGAAVDQLSVRFGMREFTVKERRFALNNRPTALRGVWLDAHSPALRDVNGLKGIKAAGFNLIRARGALLSSSWLDACDELGLFVWFEPMLTELDAVDTILPGRVRPYRSHPSFVAISLPAGLAEIPECIRSIRADDPSRLLLLPGDHDSSTPASIVRPYHDTPEPCDNLTVFIPSPSERAFEHHCQRNGSTDRLVMFGEAGVRGFASDADTLKSLMNARGLEAVFGTTESFQTAIVAAQSENLRTQIDAMRGNAKASAYCLHLPGTYFNEPDTGPLRQTVRLGQVPLRLVVECDRTNIAPREEVRVKVSLVNDLRVEGRADLSVQVVGPTKQVLWKKRRSVRITKGGDELWSGNLAASGTTGEHRIVARLLQGMNRVAETTIPLHVMERVEGVTPVFVGLPEDSPHERPLYREVQRPSDRPPVFIVPAMANTIRAYPSDYLADVIGEVAAGAVAIVFSPPDDWNDMADAVGEDTLTATSVPVLGGACGVYHYAKRHPVFDGLPIRSLLGAAYRNVLPLKAFIEEGEQDICGCLDANALNDPNSANPWRSNILVKRHGEGRIIYTHFRLLENLGQDPIAARILRNLVAYAASRAVPAEAPPFVERRALRWLKQEEPRTRRWMVLGAFPNFGEAGHDTASPPEEAIDLAAIYPGWYRAISWTRCYTTPQDDHLLHFSAATSPGGVAFTEDDYGTAYAYAEFTHAHRDAVFVYVVERNPVKLWLNGRLLFESRGKTNEGERPIATVDAMLRQGKNTVLLKVSKVPGPIVGSVDFEAKDGRPLELRWGRG